MKPHKASSSRPRRARRRTRLTSDQVRERLYEGAMSRFREQGYEATPISELTREAGVAKGTFFNHFPSKEHILASWFVGMWNETARSLSAQGTEAIVAQYAAITEKLLEDPVLAMALVTRMAGLPALDGHAAEGAETPAGSPNPLDTMRQWTGARIAESLPVVVPIQPVSDDDLSAVLVGSLMETLRELLLLSSPAHTTHTGRPATSKGGKREKARSLVTRLRFQLASAGFAVP
jgi:AcrR family transcriptional regulator